MPSAERVFAGLTTGERVAIAGPLRFGNCFETSKAAQGLLAQGLIMEPPDHSLPAPLSILGLEVRKIAMSALKKRRMR